VDTQLIYPLAFGDLVVSCCCYGKQKCSKARSQETEKEKGLTTQSFIHTGAIKVAPVAFHQRSAAGLGLLVRHPPLTAIRCLSDSHPRDRLTIHRSSSQLHRRFFFFSIPFSIHC
jgi:hypothetical protein